MRRITALISTLFLGLAVLTGSLLFGAGRAGAASCNPYPSGCTSPAAGITPTAPAAFPSDPNSAATSSNPGSATATSDPNSAATARTWTSSGTLAFTGADVMGTVVVGIILIAAGGVVVATTRRRRTA